MVNAFSHRTVFWAAGNRGGKDFGALSEYVSWILGYRPWDGTITAPKGSGRDWGIGCQSLTKAAELIICPYFEERAGHFIEEKVRNSNKSISYYLMKNGDRVHIMSYEQYTKSGKDTNPFEGPTWYGFYWSEPMPAGCRIATVRGLTSSRAAGWGRELICATPLQSSYLFHHVYEKAWNMGGDARHIFVVHGSIHDNPSLSDREIQEFLEDVPPEEREAREHGRFLYLAGRVFPEFESEVHLYDSRKFDPLKLNYQPHFDEPSDVPIIMSVDPHHRKPWFMSWWAVMPDESFYCVAEWPDQPYEKMKTCKLGLDDYAKVIGDIEDSFPGGKERVLWREMDPNFGRTPRQSEFGSTTLTKEMRRRGFYFRDDVNDRIHSGHSLIHTLLGYDKDRPIDTMNRPRMYIEKNLRNHIHAYYNYTWDEFSDSEKPLKDKPKDLGKDCIDSDRYALMRKPNYISWQDRGDWYSKQRFRRMRRGVDW